MATTNIPFDRTKELGQELRHLLVAYRKVYQDGPSVLAALSHMIDGDGSDAGHFTEMVTRGIYETTADAKASYDELASANAKLTTDASVTYVHAALKQICDKHGVIG